MKITPIQTIFSAGELSPRFLSRSDTPGYQGGCLQLDNMNVLMQGPATSRDGMQFKLPIDVDDDTQGRMFPFPVSQSEPVLIVLTDTRIKVIDAVTDLEITDFATVYDADELESIQGKFSPDAQISAPADPGDGLRLIFTTTTKVPRQIRLEPGFDIDDPAGWNFETVDFGLSVPDEWSLGNAPACMAWFQGRTYWAGTVQQPTQFWASTTTDYYDLTVGVMATDGFTESIASTGAIRWIEASRNIIIGTEFNEFILSSLDGVIEPSNPIEIQRQSANGGDVHQGLALGSKVLYVSGDGHKLYSIDFQWNEQAYITLDLSFTAEHFKDIGRIKYLSYQKNPESYIWMTTDNGLLFSCTYDPTQGVQGWAKHDTQGFVLDIATIEENGTSKTWVLVQRDDGILNVEQLGKDYFMDGVEVVTNEVAATQFTVARLANKTVQIINDGAVENDITLDDTGKGVLDNPGLVIGVGLQYNSLLETMPVDKGGSGGSAMEMTKRWNRIFARLIDSALPLINGTRPPDRDPATLMNTRQPNLTQDAEVRDLGWSIYGTVTIEMQLPLSMTVSGIFGELNQKRVG